MAADRTSRWLAVAAVAAVVASHASGAAAALPDEEARGRRAPEVPVTLAYPLAGLVVYALGRSWTRRGR